MEKAEKGAIYYSEGEFTLQRKNEQLQINPNLGVRKSSELQSSTKYQPDASRNLNYDLLPSRLQNKQNAEGLYATDRSLFCTVFPLP